MELDPIEHYEAKHAGIIPARFYKDREGITRHLTGVCQRLWTRGMCGDTLGDHDGLTSFDEPRGGFLGKRISGDETD